MTERLDIEKGIFGLAKVYNYDLTNELIDIWKNVLSDLTEEEFANGCKRYLQANSAFFPKPGQIFELAKPQIDEEQEASLISDVIFDCLQRCAYDSVGTHRAKTKVGEIGWAWVLRQGGWESFCKSVREEGDVPILKSQCRKSIMGLISRKRRGISLVPEIGRQDSLSSLEAVRKIDNGSTTHDTTNESN